MTLEKPLDSSSRDDQAAERTFHKQEKMGNILMLLLITLVLTAPCCCEGDTTRLLDDEVKITRKTANAFMKRQKRSYPYYERYYEMFKTPLELKQERCEHYAPCDYYSERVGFHTAYSYYFGNV